MLRLRCFCHMFVVVHSVGVATCVHGLRLAGVVFVYTMVTNRRHVRATYRFGGGSGGIFLIYAPRLTQKI